MNELDYYNMQESAAMAKCHEELMAVLKGYDSGRWDWDRIDVCLTYKDADLTPWGHQGIEIVHVSEDDVIFTVHGGKTFAGSDVSLNFPDGKDADDEYYFKAIDVWLDQAHLVVQGAGSSGMWTGDDWFMDFEAKTSVEWQFDPDGEMSYELTAKAIVEKAEEVIKPWEAEMVLADKFMNQLSGWTDKDGNHLPEGKPDMELSIFNPAYFGE